MNILCFYSVLRLQCLCACLLICALPSPAGKGLTYWLLFVVSNCDFVTLPIGILGQVWYLIVAIPDLCTLNHFAMDDFKIHQMRLGLKVFNSSLQASTLSFAHL